MVARHQYIFGFKTFCSNPLENGFTDDDGRHTMDARARGVALLCSITKQS